MIGAVENSEILIHYEGSDHVPLSLTINLDLMEASKGKIEKKSPGKVSAQKKETEPIKVEMIKPKVKKQKKEEDEDAFE